MSTLSLDTLSSLSSNSTAPVKSKQICLYIVIRVTVVIMFKLQSPWSKQTYNVVLSLDSIPLVSSNLTAPVENKQTCHYGLTPMSRYKTNIHKRTCNIVIRVTAVIML